MITRLIQATIERHVFVNLLFFLLMGLGIFALATLPVERYPNVQMGEIIISTIYPGASPTDVESLVTRKIEEAVEDVENISYVEAKSYRERSQVKVKFVDDVDYQAGYNDVRFKVLGILNELPEGVDPSVFTKIDVSEWLPAVSVNLTGNRTNRALALMAEEMKIPLRALPGVKEVKLEGEYQREFHVSLDPDLLYRYGVTFNQAVQAIENANVSIPAGDFVGPGGEYVVRVDERFTNPDQVAEAIIRKDSDGSFVRVRDVMDKAVMSFRDPFVITSVNGEPCVTLRVIKTVDGNVLDIVPKVMAIVDQFAPVLAEEGVRVVYTQDQRIKVFDSVNTLVMNMLVGVILVCLVLWVFLGFRNAALTSVGIPFSFLATMVIMNALGYSLNEITLFSFVLVSGIIVDDAIVVVENIHRYVQQGTPLKQAVVEGTAEVFLPVVAATSTTVAAFLPMLIMSGSTGEFFAQIPKAVAVAIAASLLECLIILPSHFLDWPGRRRIAEGRGRKFARSGKIVQKLVDWASALLRLCLRFRFLSLAAVFSAFALAMVIMFLSVSGKVPIVKIKFFPDEYEYYYVELHGPMGTPIETTEDKLNAISRLLLAQGQGKTKACTAFAGFYTNTDYQQVYGRNLGNIVVELPVKEDRRFADHPANDPMSHLQAVRELLSPFEGGGWDIRVRAEKGGPPAGKDVNIRVVGSNPESVQALAANMTAWVRGNEKIAPYLVDLTDNQGRPSRVFRFVPLDEQAAVFGGTPMQAGLLAASVLDGRYAGKFRAWDEEVDLKVKIKDGYINSPEDSLSIPLFEHASGPVRLGDVVEVKTFLEPGYLNRYQGSREISLTADIKTAAPISGTSVVFAVRQYYETVRDQFPGAGLSFAGAFESTRKSYVSLAYAFFIAVFIIYLILATQFSSYTQPAIILSAVVFALTGVILGAAASQTVFTVNSFVATVGVTGVVVNDSLVFIDFINRNYKSGMPRREAIFNALRVRLRPILLTTLTTTLGLLPMALGIPQYSLVWGSMATTFVTGLCTATFLTLFIVPVLWDLHTAAKERLAAKRTRKAGA